MELIVHFVLLSFYSACKNGVEASLGLPDASVVAINRQNNGDIFSAKGGECNPDTCIGLSSGTAAIVSSSEVTDFYKDGFCTCQCHRHLPAFREDLHICVDDIHECVLAPFVSGSTSQQIPFVFLPLKGQIIHPSKEISFTGIQTPVCAVSGAKFLTESGWIDLRSPIDADVPFRLFRDEGRTFLQWMGESELRTRMSGRLVLVHLMCRDLATPELTDLQSVFAPCVAFRIVGTPLKYSSNVSEVIFSADAHAAENSTTDGLSVSEYIAIAICSILLGLIYVASVFLYLHLRKRRRDVEDQKNESLAEEGIIKNNPLLGMGRHFSAPETAYSDSGSSDTEAAPDIIQHHDDRKKNIQVTSALIHPMRHHDISSFPTFSMIEPIPQDQTSIECLPEENVSIVETMEGREEHSECFKSITGTTRRKLYFNPAYFEPHLLMAPPPAALEFLTKIREVITIAKQKMTLKKFTPSLIGIPEEENPAVRDAAGLNNNRRGSMISLKRENSRRRTCTGCPGCEPQDLKTLCGKLPEFPSLVACQSCASSATEIKQRSIQKWLEDVPILTDNGPRLKPVHPLVTSPKRVRSPTRSLPLEISSPVRPLSPRPFSDRAVSPSSLYDHTKTSSEASSSKSGSKSSKRSKSKILPPKHFNLLGRPLSPDDISAPILNTSRQEVTEKRYKKAAVRSKSPPTRKIAIKPKAPPPPVPQNRLVPKVENIYDKLETTRPLPLKTSLPPPDMIHEAMAVESKSEDIKIPTITRKKMEAVINEFTTQRGIDNTKNDSSSSPELSSRIDYDTDSLERTGKGYCTPTEYAEISSSQPSPSLSAALPMTEEMTMRNAILNTKTGNMTLSKLNMDVLKEDDHDYELIVLKKGDHMKVSEFYSLPEFLQRRQGYSLVSEVYVNNGYNYNSASSSATDSNCSTLEAKSKVEDGRLTIEVKDCPDHYIRVDVTEDFEPDTLDRKPSKKIQNQNSESDFVDSLERPNLILLRTNGSFKKPDHNTINGKNILSLREIYEAKNCEKKNEENDEKGRILTLEERHSKRQRPSTVNAIPPDVIPPPPHNQLPIYECPKPPRKVFTNIKPPLPPKKLGKLSSLSGASTPTSSDYEACVPGKLSENNTDISILQNFIHADDVMFKNGLNNQFILQAATVTSNPKIIIQSPLKSLQSLMKPNLIHHMCDNKKADNVKKTWQKIVILKPEDSGYLSTDSNESQRKKHSGSETDESLGDGHSESGAESVETHSVFFGSYRKATCSIDSGLSLKSTENILNDDLNSSDSETVSYTTIVPCNTSTLTRRRHQHLD